MRALRIVPSVSRQRQAGMAPSTGLIAPAAAGSGGGGAGVMGELVSGGPASTALVDEALGSFIASPPTRSRVTMRRWPESLSSKPTTTMR